MLTLLTDMMFGREEMLQIQGEDGSVGRDAADSSENDEHLKDNKTKLEGYT